MPINKIVIFGNSASGKSSYARYLSQTKNLAHLDLDSVAWQPMVSTDATPQRRLISESMRDIQSFLVSNSNWVIEGCYGDLVEAVSEYANQLIFLNLSSEQCIVNAKRRPWEPHKYASKEEQDANLEMLLNWISDYDQRSDTCSKQEHLRIFGAFSNDKKMLVEMPSLDKR